MSQQEKSVGMKKDSEEGRQAGRQSARQDGNWAGPVDLAFFNACFDLT